MPHPSGLRVRVFLRCVTRCDAITGETISTLLLSVATADGRFSGGGGRGIVL